ncbi:MAG TPA: glycosyltransferase family 4 protein [Burkholderiales bacterium]
MKRTVLLVPGFVADTYCEIERSYVELSAAAAGSDLRFVWLVPEIDWKYNSFKNPANRGAMDKPACVPHLERHGVPVVFGNLSKYNPIRNYLVFRRVFRQFDVDAVYTHFGFERFWATFFAKLWGKTTIWNEHWNSLNTRYVLAKRVFYRLFVDEFIAVSRFIQGTLPKGKPAHAIPNAVADVARNPCSEEIASLRRRLGIDDRAQVVLMVAGFRPEKRHGLALDVCERVRARLPSTVFVFVGDGVTRGQFLREVRARGLERCVVAPGHVENVDDYYAMADVCMLTSYNDGFGYCVIEAMRAGRPMIAFANGGPGEIIRPEETGVLIRDGDVAAFAERLVGLLEDPVLRRRLGDAAREVVRREYSRETWARRLNGVLESIVDRHRKQGSGGGQSKRAVGSSPGR